MEISKCRKGVCNHANRVPSLNYRQILFKKSTIFIFKKNMSKNKFTRRRVCNLFSVHTCICKNIIHVLLDPSKESLKKQPTIKRQKTRIPNY